MKKVQKILPLLFVAFLTVLTVEAAPVTLNTIFDSFTVSLSAFVGIGVTIALAVFVWGVIMFIQKSGDDTAIAEGRKRMIWGVVGLFVIVSVWGLVSILQVLLGASGQPDCSAPSIDIWGVDQDMDLNNCF